MEKIILIVEDDEASQVLVSTYLKLDGYKFYCVSNGIEAIDLCRKHKIDLVLMDIKIPMLDGYEATKEIRKFNKEIIIIAQTAFALIGDKEKALDAGCNDYLSKPFSRIELSNILKKYLSI